MPRVMLAAIIGGVFALTFVAQASRAFAAAPDTMAVAEGAAELVAANPAGAATITVVVNYENAATRALHVRLSAFARANADIKIAVRPVLGGGPLAEFLAKAAYTTARQGKFQEFHDAALSSPQAHTWYSLRDSAPLIGVDWSRFQQDYQSPEIGMAVQANAKYADDMKIPSVPAIIAAGRVFTGPPEKLDLNEIARAARGN